MRQRMVRTGNCYDNAVAESFFATLKKEMYHHTRCATVTEARFAIAEYIECSTTSNDPTHPWATSHPPRQPNTAATAA